MIDVRNTLSRWPGQQGTRAAVLPNVIVVLCAVLIALGIVIALALRLPTRIDTPVVPDRMSVQLTGFEEADAGDGEAARRLRTDASIAYRSGGPADFNIVLFLRGDPGLKEPYSLPLAINGSAVEPLSVVAGTREYRLHYRLIPAAWNPMTGDTVQLTLAPSSASAATPLPVALTRVTIAPASSLSSLDPMLLSLYVSIVVAIWLALRLFFVGQFARTLIATGFGLLSLAVAAIVRPAQVLYGSQQPGLHPKRAVAFLLAVPLGAWALSVAIRYLKRRYRAPAAMPAETYPDTYRRVLTRDLLLVFMVAFGFRIIWALLVPPWQAPDEGAHFSYIYHIVESAELPHVGTHEQNYPSYSAELIESWNNTLYGRVSTVGLPRIPELPFYPPSYDYSIARNYQAPLEQRQSSAGGSATPYPPLYYLVAALPYKFFQQEPIVSRLFASRTISAVFGALGCLFGYLMAYELRRERAWGFAVGLCMATLPMYAFISSSINNDTAMVCFTTALIWLAVRALQQQSMSPRILWAMGAVGGGVLLTKPTGMVIVVLVGAVLLVYHWPILRHPARIEWPRVRALARFVLPVIGLYSLLILVRLVVSRTSTGTSSVVGTTITLMPKYSFSAYIQNEIAAGGSYYFWLFIKTFWGIFGWLEIVLPEEVYSAILIFSSIAIFGFGLNIVLRAQTRRWSLLLLALILGQAVFLFVVADYFLSFAQLGIGLGLQGRYLFPVLAPILFLLIDGWYSLSGRKKLILYLAPFAMLLLQILSLATIVTKYYGITFGW